MSRAVTGAEKESKRKQRAMEERKTATVAIKIALHLMLTKAQIKHIRSLGQPKYRLQHQQFVAEGDKIAKEWLHHSGPIAMVVCLGEWADAHESLLALHPEAAIHVAPVHVMEQITQLQTPPAALLVCPIPEPIGLLPKRAWTIAAAGIQDPGNLGTMIRIADWFGIHHMVCSPDTVDAYNPKVVQAAMGSHLRVTIYTESIEAFAAQYQARILAATLGGLSVYQVGPQQNAALVIGNESRGLSDSVLSLCSQEVTIPRLGGAESLNAAVSTGILCAMLKPAPNL